MKIMIQTGIDHLNVPAQDGRSESPRFSITSPQAPVVSFGILQMESFMIRKLTAAVLLLVSSAAFAQAPGWAKIRIGVEANYPPFSQMGTDGKFSGFDIDIANALCAEMKAECTMVAQEWDGMMPALNAKKFDMIVASMSITEERKKAADFSDSYYDIPSAWVAKAGAFKEVNATTLKGKKIIVTRNTPRAAYVQANFKDNDVLLVAKEADVTMELAAGRGDIGFGSSLAATAAFLKSPEGKNYTKVGAPVVVGGAKDGGGVGIAMRKGEEALKSKVNAALKTITANGVYKSINDKYFDVNIRGQ
ncbi:ABC transporter substrate-binding protein [Polaromonas sp. SP1]|nr:ABC transporter substrate-binding protein [Polaromonas sp. SP1]QGJ20378.1 transporter substrate-binding domain-containing protein [Polaromonas sp. Pch-P]